MHGQQNIKSWKFCCRLFTIVWEKSANYFLGLKRPVFKSFRAF